MHPNTPKYEELLKIKEEMQLEDPDKVDVRKLKAIQVQIVNYKHDDLDK
jgi:hypothetical protein